MSFGAWLTVGILVFAAVESVFIVWAIVHFGWAPLHKNFPTQEPADGAVRRPFQSFKVGVMSFGFSMHVTVDEIHLHLEPARILRWAGAHTASIPWADINITKRSRNGRWLIVKADKWTIQGPAWCLKLAEQ